MIKDIKNILEEDALPINNSMETYIDTNNGILNDQLLERQKKMFLKDSMSYVVDDLVKITQDYPHDNLSKVEFSTGFYIIRWRDFVKLKELVDKLEERLEVE